jgi:serine/threonine protein kinase
VFSKESRDRDPSSPIPPFARSYFGTQGHEASLRIVEGKAIGRAKGAQVFLCEVQTTPSEYWKAMGWTDSHFPTKVIAKIFDPLYYPTISPYGGERLDLVSWADKQFAHEAAAYIEIHGHRQEHPIIDDITPNFFGTFTITHESPTDKYPYRFRQVRVVLLEYIEGTSLLSLCSRRSPDILVPTERAGTEEERLQVFARMLHGIVAMERIGVFHEDPDPRNIIIAENKAGTSAKRVVITDFNISRVERYTESGRHFAQDLPRPLHPRWRFGIDGFERFGGWFPREWLDYVEPYRRDSDDSDTDPDEEAGDGPGPSFTKWARKTFHKDEFVLADEADEIAERQDAEAGAQQEKDAMEVDEHQPV